MTADVNVSMRIRAIGGEARAAEIFDELKHQLRQRTDRMFAWLLGAQWLLAFGLALLISPYTYGGASRTIHLHVKLALGLGAAINALPLFLIATRPGATSTRHAIAVAQMLWSALLIMITGGRIETHFHVFGSLAFLAFYRDWRVLATATAIVVADHLVRGLWWPQTVYGISNPESWRFLEHGAWVMFEDVVLVFGCVRSLGELRERANQQVALEATTELVEREVHLRTVQLEDSVSRYRALVENTDAIPFEYNPTTRKVVYLAPQVTRLLGSGSARVKREFFRKLIHSDDRERCVAALHDYASGDGPSAIEYRLVRHDGEIAYVRTMFAQYDEDTSLIRGITLDITKQTLLEAELRQAQKLESVGRLAAGVAHEINTPVQFVGDSVQFASEAVGDLFGAIERHRASTHAILDGTASPELARAALAADEAADLPYLTEQVPGALDRAVEGLARVSTIVQSMKAFAHPDQRERTAIDLNAAIGSTLTIARNEYKYVADLELDLGELPPVECYAGEINQVMLNLVVNAAHAIADVVAGTDRRGKITVRSRADAGDVVISVTDTGGGIPSAIRERIFDPFFTTKLVGRGTGQGLAIARTVVVDKHHGTLTFDTVVGHGTTFTIRIPVTTNALTEAGAAA
jgi:PAS domain S-box-containing protein